MNYKFLFSVLIAVGVIIGVAKLIEPANAQPVEYCLTPEFVKENLTKGKKKDEVKLAYSFEGETLDKFWTALHKEGITPDLSQGYDRLELWFTKVKPDRYHNIFYERKGEHLCYLRDSPILKNEFDAFYKKHFGQEVRN